MSESDLDRLRDILGCLQAIDLAEASVQRYPGDLDVARFALDAVRGRVAAIGEAVRCLSLDLREDHPATPWSDMALMPELIGGDYDRLEPTMMAATIGEPVRALRAACRAILAESARVGEDEP